MPSFFHRYVVTNFGLKLISVLLAIGLWLVVARDPIAEVELKIPIEFHNLPDARTGERTFDLTAQQIRLPQDLDVVQIIPSQFQLSFDTRMTRTVEVRPRVTGSFATRSEEHTSE